MGRARTAWHLMAASFLDERRPQSVSLDSEFVLTLEPQRADILLVQKADGPIDDARAFYRLWALMGRVALVAYKSRSRPPRSGVMSQLLGYGHQYARDRRDELGDVENLSLFLLVHALTPALRDDVTWLGYRLAASEGAYTRVEGPAFPTWIVALNTLADEEGEPLIGQLGSRTLDEEDVESSRWLARFVMSNQERAKDLEDFDELKAQFLKSELFKEMLAETPLSDRLRDAGSDEVAEALTPEQRATIARALPAEQRYAEVLAMTDEALRGLPDSFIDALPEPVRTEIRRRLAH